MRGALGMSCGIIVKTVETDEIVGREMNREYKEYCIEHGQSDQNLPRKPSTPERLVVVQRQGKNLDESESTILFIIIIDQYINRQ